MCYTTRFVTYDASMHEVRALRLGQKVANLVCFILAQKRKGCIGEGQGAKPERLSCKTRDRAV